MELAEAIVKGGVVLLVGIGAVSDLRTRRIPNVLTFGGAAAGLLVNVAFYRLAGISASLGGWALATALLLIPFFLRGMGGGDVKLLAAVGAWGGPSFVLAALFYAAVAGGIMALVVVIVQGRLGAMVRPGFTWLRFQVGLHLGVLWPGAMTAIVGRGSAGPAPAPRPPSYLPYGPAIAVGGIVAILLGGL